MPMWPAGWLNFAPQGDDQEPHALLRGCDGEPPSPLLSSGSSAVVLESPFSDGDVEMAVAPSVMELADPVPAPRLGAATHCCPTDAACPDRPAVSSAT